MSESAKEKKAKRVEVQVRLDEETAQGVYANMAIVSHTDAEFTLDFVYVPPRSPQAKVRARIITSPRHVKRLLQALAENVSEWETRHGPLEPGAAPATGVRH